MDSRIAFLKQLRFRIFILSAALIFSVVTPGWARVKGVQAYADQQTWFNSVTDSLATLGEPAPQKAVTKAMRRAARRKARLEKLQQENSRRANQR
ncbi:MAG: hypothetical protein HZA29_01820 [Candidatus Omnitrophica bacterium]|nr:hypothetical protein [Candidatus Omnitrophota bacterium]